MKPLPNIHDEDGKFNRKIAGIRDTYWHKILEGRRVSTMTDLVRIELWETPGNGLLYRCVAMPDRLRGVAQIGTGEHRGHILVVYSDAYPKIMHGDLALWGTQKSRDNEYSIIHFQTETDRDYWITRCQIALAALNDRLRAESDAGNGGDAADSVDPWELLEDVVNGKKKDQFALYHAITAASDALAARCAPEPAGNGPVKLNTLKIGDFIKRVDYPEEIGLICELDMDHCMYRNIPSGVTTNLSAHKLVTPMRLVPADTPDGGDTPFRRVL